MQLIKIVVMLKNFIYKLIYKTPKVMSDEETIEYIINNECSVARFGDGEISIMLNKDISWFQDKSILLKRKLEEVAETNNKSLLLCVPEIISEKPKCNLTKDAKKFWKKHKTLYGGYYNKYFNKQSVLGDTNVTRFYLGVENKDRTKSYINKIKKIWQNRNLLIVEGKNTKLGIGNDLFDNAKGIRRILCPNKNAFEKYDKIIDSILKNYSKDDLVIVALGPTATILVGELCVKHGIRSLDLGHIDIEYMWYLNNDDKRGSINNKNTAEKNNEIDERDLTKNAIEIIE